MAPEGGRPLDNFRLLGDRNFAPYFWGNLLSNCGTWFQTLAQAILVYRLTGSAFLLGLVGFAQFAGVFLLAPWSGSVADRFDRRRILLVTQSGAVLITGALAVVVWTGAATAWNVIAFAFALGFWQAFAWPALQALVPSLVAPERLGAAIALHSVTFNLSRAAGPSAAALVIATAGLEWAFVVNALSYLALVAALLVVRPRPSGPRPHRPRLRESIALVRRRPRLAAFMLVSAVASAAVEPVSTLAPAFARDVWGRPDTLAGVIIGAFGVGAVAAAFTVAGRAGPLRRQIVLRLSILGGGIAAFSFAPTLEIGLVLLALAGFGFLAANTAATTQLQLEIEDEHRGRIMALWTVAFLGIRPLASLVDGAVASVAGVRIASLLMALPALAVAAAFALHGSRGSVRSVALTSDGKEHL
jgi:MFS family permease